MSAAIAIVLVIVVVAAIAFVTFLASRIAAAPPANVGSRPGDQIPGYRPSPEIVRYSGQRPPEREEKSSVPDKRAHGDPRQTPLPRCPACGAAIAYGDVKCRKCGHDLALSE